MRSAIALATTLSRFTADNLAQLIAARFSEQDPVPSHHTDVAIQLLKPDSIERILRTSDINVLRAVADPQRFPQDEVLQLGLAQEVDGARSIFPEVREVFDRLLKEHGLDATDLANWSADTGAGSASRIEDDHWAHTAFLAGQRCVLLIRGFDRVPARVTRAGTLSVSTQKLLAESMQIPVEHIPRLWTVIQALGAAVVHERTVRATDFGRGWILSDHATRWLTLAASLLADMPAPLRDSLTDSASLTETATNTVPLRYPLLDKPARNAIGEYADVAEAIGVTEKGTLTPAVLELLRTRPTEALHVTRNAFPSVAPGVYIQPDLSLIAPGPLEPALGQRLLDLAQLSNPGVATSMHLTKESLSAALDHGWTVTEIRDVLTQAALTPLPQPLDYLLDDLERTHGSIVITEHNQGGSFVSVTTEQLARELLADSRLQALALTPHHDNPLELRSRLGASSTHAMLTDAGVPALLRSEPSGVRHTKRPRAFTDDVAVADWVTQHLNPPRVPAWALDLAVALTSATQHAPEEAITHALELAIRTGGTLQVTVSAGSHTRDFVLQPLTITGNRLRALDPVAQLERTFSLSAITEVEPTPAIS